MDPNHLNNSNSNSNHPPLSLLLTNLQSILSKKKSFWEMLDNYSPDIAVGCETWLTSSVLNNEIMPRNYKLYRKDWED